MKQPFLHMVLKIGDNLRFRSELNRNNFWLASKIDPQLSQYAELFGSRFIVDRFTTKALLRYPNPFSIPPGVYYNSQEAIFKFDNNPSNFQIPLKYLQLPDDIYLNRINELPDNTLDYPGPKILKFTRTPMFDFEDLVTVNDIDGYFVVTTINYVKNSNSLGNFIYKLSPVNSSNGGIIEHSSFILESNIKLYGPGRIKRFFDNERVSFSNIYDEIRFRYLAGQTRITLHDDLEFFFFKNIFYSRDDKYNLVYTSLLSCDADFVLGYNFRNNINSLITTPNHIIENGSLLFGKFNDHDIGDRIRLELLKIMPPSNVLAEA